MWCRCVFLAGWIPRQSRKCWASQRGPLSAIGGMQNAGCFENCAPVRLPVRLMDTELWQNVKALLDSVWECPEPERRAFLREAMVQDPILAQEVNSLLANEDYAGDFIERPIIDASDLGDLYEAQVAQLCMSDAIVGQTISHYRIVKRL